MKRAGVCTSISQSANYHRDTYLIDSMLLIRPGVVRRQLQEQVTLDDPASTLSFLLSLQIGPQIEPTLQA